MFSTKPRKGLVLRSTNSQACAFAELAPELYVLVIAIWQRQPYRDPAYLVSAVALSTISIVASSALIASVRVKHHHTDSLWPCFHSSLIATALIFAYTLFISPVPPDGDRSPFLAFSLLTSLFSGFAIGSASFFTAFYIAQICK